MIYFVSSNKHKFDEIQLILSNNFGLKIKFMKTNLVEIQSERIEEIATKKSITAFNKIKKPLIIEDTGLFIDSLNGFPGPYSSYVLKTIGNKGILKILKGINRNAMFKTIIVYNDGVIVKKFIGETKGKIDNRISKGGWGYDPIFVPETSNLSYGMLEKENEKNKISHRMKAINKFANWLLKKSKKDVITTNK